MGFLPSIYEETNIPAEIHLDQIVLLLLLAGLVALSATWLSVRRLCRSGPPCALCAVSFLGYKAALMENVRRTRNWRLGRRFKHSHDKGLGETKSVGFSF